MEKDRTADRKDSSRRSSWRSAAWRNIANSSGLEEAADGGVKEEDGAFDIARLMSKIFVVARQPRDAVGEEWHHGGRRG